MFQTTKKVAARMLLIGTALLLSLFPLYSFAQTHIYVVNGTGAELLVRGVQIGGDAISKKAWKKGVSQIADGDKKKVLAVNRTGKFNWMDPTPRFVEPGKTTTFTVELGSALSAAEEQTLALKLKLLGTGKSSKMWYTLGGATTEFDWQLEPEEFEAQWSADVDTTFSVSFRAYEDGGKTHVEYSVTHEP